MMTVSSWLLWGPKREAWVQVFEFMDEDASGKLDKIEIFLAMRRLGYSAASWLIHPTVGHYRGATLMRNSAP